MRIKPGSRCAVKWTSTAGTEPVMIQVGWASLTTAGLRSRRGRFTAQSQSHLEGVTG